MVHTDKIPMEVVRCPESWYHWPQQFTVPKDWWYKTDTMPCFEQADKDTAVSLCCAGDWVEMLQDREEKHIRYEIG